MITSYVTLAISIGLFVFFLNRMTFITLVKKVLRLTGQAIAVMQSRDLSDHQKEKQVQTVSVKIFQLFFYILINTFILIGATLIVPLTGFYLSLYNFSQLFAAATNTYFLIISFFVTLVFLWLSGKAGG